MKFSDQIAGMTIGQLIKLIAEGHPLTLSIYMEIAGRNLLKERAERLRDQASEHND